MIPNDIQRCHSAVELPKTGLSENRIPLKTEHLVLVRNIPLYI
jgi:hypothetical protein